MPPKKTFESKLKDWHEEFVWFICAEDHLHCEVCKRAKVGGLWSNCRKVSEKLQKSLLTDHSKENRHLSALEICKEQDRIKFSGHRRRKRHLRKERRSQKSVRIIFARCFSCLVKSSALTRILQLSSFVKSAAWRIFLQAPTHPLRAHGVL